MVKSYGFNKTKKEAFEETDRLVKRSMPAGILKDSLIYIIVKASGLSEGLVLKYIDRSIDVGVYELEDEIIKWSMKNVRNDEQAQL